MARTASACWATIGLMQIKVTLPIGRVPEGDGTDGQRGTEELRDDEAGHRGGPDAGERAGEGTADGHGRVCEGRGAGEPVRGTDVSTHRGRGRGRSSGASQREDEQHQ